MTTYTAIPDGNIDAGSPLRDVDMTLLRDNPIAITEGAAGAPRVQDAALDTSPTNAGAAWVQNRLAFNNIDAIGWLTFAQPNTGTTTYNPDDTIAGSDLSPAGITGGSQRTGSFVYSGTFRCLGYSEHDPAAPIGQERGATLWMRIA